MKVFNKTDKSKYIKSKSELNIYFAKDFNVKKFKYYNLVINDINIILNDIKSSNKVNKTELSKIVAERLAKKAKEKKISKIYFDRGIYKYHGRIKVFAETLRKNGMEF